MHLDPWVPLQSGGKYPNDMILLPFFQNVISWTSQVVSSEIQAFEWLQEMSCDGPRFSAKLQGTYRRLGWELSVSYSNFFGQMLGDNSN